MTYYVCHFYEFCPCISINDNTFMIVSLHDVVLVVFEAECSRLRDEGPTGEVLV